MTGTSLSVTLLALNIGIAWLLVIGAFRYGASRTAAARFSAGVALWLALVVALAAGGIFVSTRFRYVPVIAVAIVAPIAAGWAVVTRSASFRTAVARIPLAALVGVQLYRVAGVVFLGGMHHRVLPRLFALPAGIGDIAVGLSAPVVAYIVFRRSPHAELIALIWCLAGIADLIVAVAMGFLTSPSPFQQLAHGQTNLVTHYPYALVPAFAVPVSVVFHLWVMARLQGRNRRAASPPWAPEPALARR